jgi:hypothetical protein
VVRSCCLDASWVGYRVHRGAAARGDHPRKRVGIAGRERFPEAGPRPPHSRLRDGHSSPGCPFLNIKQQDLRSARQPVRTMHRKPGLPPLRTTCEKCHNPAAIVAYVSHDESHCMCPKCDHVWTVAREAIPPPKP